jgi:hypothetical protein
MQKRQSSLPKKKPALFQSQFAFFYTANKRKGILGLACGAWQKRAAAGLQFFARLRLVKLVW